MFVWLTTFLVVRFTHLKFNELDTKDSQKFEGEMGLLPRPIMFGIYGCGPPFLGCDSSGFYVSGFSSGSPSLIRNRSGVPASDFGGGHDLTRIGLISGRGNSKLDT